MVANGLEVPRKNPHVDLLRKIFGVCPVAVVSLEFPGFPVLVHDDAYAIPPYSREALVRKNQVVVFVVGIPAVILGKHVHEPSDVLVQIVFLYSSIATGYQRMTAN